METGNDPVSNAGAANYLVKMGDKEKEVPFTGITDASGKKIVSVLGLPASSDEIHSFIQMLKQGAPTMTQAELGVIEAKLRNSPKK